MLERRDSTENPARQLSKHGGKMNRNDDKDKEKKEKKEEGREGEE